MSGPPARATAARFPTFLQTGYFYGLAQQHIKPGTIIIKTSKHAA